MYPVMDLWKSHPLWRKVIIFLQGIHCLTRDTTVPFLTRLDSTPGKVHPAPRSSATSATKMELLQLLPKVKINTRNSPCYIMNAISVWSPAFNIFIVLSFQQLSKGFALTPGFPTMATAFTSIVLLKHGPMLRKSAAKKEETSPVSTMWRSRALSFLTLDLVCKKHKITNIAILFLSFFIVCRLWF